MVACANDVPVLAVGNDPDNGDWPGDRQRFTLAHELAHIVLEGRLQGVDLEPACNRFAGAFLVPASTARRELGSTRRRLEPAELHGLEHEYGMSMMAWVHRAHELGVISGRSYKEHRTMFRERGWLEKEPREQVCPRPPRLFDRLVFRALGEGHIGFSKAAELLGITARQLQDRRMMVAAIAQSDGA